MNSINSKTRSDLKLEIKMVEKKIEELQKELEKSGDPKLRDELQKQIQYRETLKTQYEAFKTIPKSSKDKTGTFEEDRLSALWSFLGSLILVFSSVSIAYSAQQDGIIDFLFNWITFKVYPYHINQFDAIYQANNFYLTLSFAIGAFFMLLAFTTAFAKKNYTLATVSFLAFIFAIGQSILFMFDTSSFLTLMKDYSGYLNFPIVLFGVVFLILLLVKQKRDLLGVKNIFYFISLVFLIGFTGYSFYLVYQGLTLQGLYDQLFLVLGLEVITFSLFVLASLISFFKK